jgi:hypothetical protein
MSGGGGHKGKVSACFLFKLMKREGMGGEEEERGTEDKGE